VRNEIAEVMQQYDELDDGEFTRFDREGARGQLVYETELRELLERTEPEDRVLDAGGGAGKFAVPLAEQGRQVDLVDLSKRQCQLAAERANEQDLAARLTVTRGDIRSLSYDTNIFDTVVCLGGALSHVLGDIEESVGEFARVARPGATAVTSVMNRSMSHKDLPHALDRNDDRLPDALSQLAEKKRRRQDEYDDTIGPFFKYTSEEMRSILERHGFDVITSRALDRHPIFIEPYLSSSWDDDIVMEAIVEYEREVSSLPWFRDTGNMSLHVSRLGRASKSTYT
jgi:ubiquinone/menaquinone biosynthesis C-methylase UbiE